MTKSILEQLDEAEKAVSDGREAFHYGVPTISIKKYDDLCFELEGLLTHFNIRALINVAKAADELIAYIAPPITDANPPAAKLREALGNLKGSDSKLRGRE